jgi:shikimate dehydrogenase
VVDLVYTDTETPLVQAARACRVRVVGGRELLVRQGALSFQQFTGRAAPIDVMRRAVDGR